MNDVDGQPYKSCATLFLLGLELTKVAKSTVEALTKTISLTHSSWKTARLTTVFDVFAERTFVIVAPG